MSDFASALDSALSLVSKRDRSERFVRSFLAHSGIEPDVIDAVVDRLRSRQILDDNRLAQASVRSAEKKGFGPERIRLDLERLGISPDLIENSMHDLAASATELVQQTLRDRLKKNPTLDRARAGRFLAGRGFSDEDVEQALSLVYGAGDAFTE